MHYVLILPVFSVLFLVLVIATSVTYSSPNLKVYFPLAWRLLLWTTVGFIGFNLIFWILMIGYVLVSGSIELQTSFDDVKRFVAIVGLTLGPFIASVVGVLAGVFYVWIRRKNFFSL